MGQNVGAGQEDKGRNRKRLESLVEDRQTKMGCGSQNGSKWTVGISDCCSEACWFEAWSRMGPERKARARRLQKQRVKGNSSLEEVWMLPAKQAVTRSRVHNARSEAQNGNAMWSGYWKTTRG